MHEPTKGEALSPGTFYGFQMWKFCREESSWTNKHFNSVFGFESPEGAVYDTWRVLFLKNLISPLDVAGAIDSGELKEFFLNSVEKFSKPCRQKWAAVPECQKITAGNNEVCADMICSTPTITEVEAASTTEARQQYEDFTSSFMKDAVVLKDKGNQIYLEKDFAGAIKAYDEALQILQDPKGSSEYPVFTWNLISILYSNKSQCLLFLEEWNDARRAAVASLKYNEANEKALARKSKAEEMLLGELKGIERTARERALKETCSQQ